MFILAVLGWRGAPRRWRWLLVGALLLMLGRFTPVYGLFHLLPGFDHFRFPVRFSLLLTLAASLLAGFGTQWLLQQRSSPSAERWLGRGIVVFVVAAGLGSLALSQVEPILRDILSGALGGREGAEERIQAFISGMEWNTSLLSPGVLWPASLAAATLGIARALRLGRLHQVTAGMALAVLGSGPGALHAPVQPDHAGGAGRLGARGGLGDHGGAGLYRSTVVDRVSRPSWTPCWSTRWGSCMEPGTSSCSPRCSCRA